MAGYCQNCGKDTGDAEPVTFYGNILCSKDCQKSLGERLYFRDDPPEEGSTWFCPHCGNENPLGDPKVNLRPDCTSCGKPLDPASATPPGNKGCLLLVLPCLAAAGALLS